MSSPPGSGPRSASTTTSRSSATTTAFPIKLSPSRLRRTPSASHPRSTLNSSAERGQNLGSQVLQDVSCGEAGQVGDDDVVHARVDQAPVCVDDLLRAADHGMRLVLLERLSAAVAVR